MDGSAGIPPTPFRFSNDELRALQECNSESFFYRCLPMGVLMGVGTHIGVKNGYLSATRYGSAPKVALAIVAGYILGKISYQGKCAEKIMALPDSKLGAMLRERRRTGKYTESLTLDQPEISKLFGDSPPSDVYSDLGRSESAPSHMDIDVHQDMDIYWKGLEENRPGDDILQPPPQSKTITSYDELRRKNREEYDASRSQYQRPAAKPEDTMNPPPPVYRPPPPPQDEFPRNKTTNQYGDSWEK